MYRNSPEIGQVAELPIRFFRMFREHSLEAWHGWKPHVVPRWQASPLASNET
jgi:hypothetical protein